MAKGSVDSRKLTFGKRKKVRLKNLITNILHDQKNTQDKEDKIFKTPLLGFFYYRIFFIFV